MFDVYTYLVNASFGGEVLEIAVVHPRFFLPHGGVDECGSGEKEREKREGEEEEEGQW